MRTGSIPYCRHNYTQSQDFAWFCIICILYILFNLVTVFISFNTNIKNKGLNDPPSSHLQGSILGDKFTPLVLGIKSYYTMCTDRNVSASSNIKNCKALNLVYVLNNLKNAKTGNQNMCIFPKVLFCVGSDIYTRSLSSVHLVLA